MFPNERIEQDPTRPSGKAVIKGTRISVDFVLELLGRGWTPDEILQEYSQLVVADIEACLAYANSVAHPD